jgi:hypothetical protein
MNDLIIPSGGPRVPPLTPAQVNADVRSEYDKSVNTWGIPNNLIRTMAWLPQLALTEVNYANSFIFDQGKFCTWPQPGASDGAATVVFPAAGFVDRVTKELVINLVSLMNRSRYSITHHTVIGYMTLQAAMGADRADDMLFHLVDATGRASFEDRTDHRGKAIYEPLHLIALRLADRLRRDAHAVSDADFKELRAVCRADAERQLEEPPLKHLAGGANDDYVEAYVNGMIVELTWCIVHFAGLLNNWFTVLRIADEDYPVNPAGQTFIEVYNSVVPERIRTRNNNLLGKNGWGSDDQLSN